MKNKEIISIAEIICGALLKFNKIDNLDLSIIKSDLQKEKNVIIIESASPILDDYVRRETEISLLPSFTLNTIIGFNYKNEFSLKTLFKFYQGEIVSNYFEEFDIYIHVLKKLSILKNATLDNFKTSFNSKQLKAIKYLLKTGYIEKYDSRNITLSKLGKMKLFIDDNDELIIMFRKILKASNYNPNLIYYYLINQDLTLNPKKILSIDKFICYMNEEKDDYQPSNIIKIYQK